MNTNLLAKQIADLARTLAELDAAPKAELTASFAEMYVPSLPNARIIAGGAPLDSQLEANASDAKQAARECDEAVARYQRVTEQAAAILKSPALKAVRTMAESGKAKAKERRAECERMAADARSELERRRVDREKAQAEAAKAQEVAEQIERLKRELADLRATFR